MVDLLSPNQGFIVGLLPLTIKKRTGASSLPSMAARSDRAGLEKGIETGAGSTVEATGAARGGGAACP